MWLGGPLPCHALHQQGNGNHYGAPDDVVPEEADAGEAAHQQHHGSASDHPDKRGVRSDPVEIERQHKDSEETAIKERAHHIDGFDERSEVSRVLSGGDCVDSPERGGRLGNSQVMMVNGPKGRMCRL